MRILARQTQWPSAFFFFPAAENSLAGALGLYFNASLSRFLRLPKIWLSHFAALSPRLGGWDGAEFQLKFNFVAVAVVLDFVHEFSDQR